MYGKSLLEKLALSHYSQCFEKTYHMILYVLGKKALWAALKTLSKSLFLFSIITALMKHWRINQSSKCSGKKDIQTNEKKTNKYSLRHCFWNTWELVQFIAHAAHATGTMGKLKLSW